MSGIMHSHYGNAAHAPSPPDEDGPLDAKQIVAAHLTGLCFGASIIPGTTAAVCAIVRLL